MGADTRFEGLPGWELVSRGLADRAAGRETVEAALVATAYVRLTELGLPVSTPHPDAPEELYRRVEAHVGTEAAHARYNALRRRLASFLRSASHAHAG
jgi:hypothetical protein